MSKTIFFLIVNLFPALCFAQRQDNAWLSGFSGGIQFPLNDLYGVTMLDFRDTVFPRVITQQENDINFSATDASICDSSGNLLFYTNGEVIYNWKHQLMENGDSLNDWDGGGIRAPQGALILPWPSHPGKYYMIYIESYLPNGIGPRKDRTSVNLIDMHQNNGLGRVVEKKTVLWNETTEWGHLAAAKHSNGRDWWILLPIPDTKSYYRFLLTRKGIEYKYLQSGSVTLTGGLGTAAFSPDGKKYARSFGKYVGQPEEAIVYDFDRRNGTLSNPKKTVMPCISFGSSAAFSPDSRLLYVFCNETVWQYDLSSSDPFSTGIAVAEYDGFISDGFNGTNFFIAQPAPDGRIYIASTGATRYLHYINFPNRRGKDCQMIQRGIELAVNNRHSLPNYPHFRLGPVDDNLGDSLGLDNHPLCNFRWEREDTLGSPLRVTFTDLSSYEPAQWRWDFGDGTASQDTSPVHEYAKPGVYEVCLIVSNPYSADTFCQTLHLGVSSTAEAEAFYPVQVSPNPFSDRLRVAFASPPGRPGGAATFRVFDLTGRTVTQRRLAQGLNEIEAGDWPPGMYFWSADVGEASLKSGKAVKIE
jgi:hypothetical protein